MIESLRREQSKIPCLEHVEDRNGNDLTHRAHRVTQRPTGMSGPWYWSERIVGSSLSWHRLRWRERDETPSSLRDADARIGCEIWT